MSVSISIRPQELGASGFRKRYGIDYAYLSGAMYKGIATKELVVAMGNAGMMGFCGTGGLDIGEIEKSIEYIKATLQPGRAYGMNLLNNIAQPELETSTVNLYLKHDVPVVEASAYMTVSQALVQYRLKGLRRDSKGSLVVPRRVIAKLSRPEVAEMFIRPASSRIVQKLFDYGKITREEATLSAYLPLADDICVESDSAGHTDGGRPFSLLPGIISLRDRLMEEYKYEQPIHIGAAGGIGTPTAAAAAFILGADFITTGSINQCTVEAGISDTVKDMLEQMDVQDTEYAPAGDMFELGARVQVLKKGVLFPGRANKLYDLYCHHQSLEEIDPKTRKHIEEKFFKRTLDEVWAETRQYYENSSPEILKKAERSPKIKMGLIFRWYFVQSTRLALQGDSHNKADFQVHCGPALGAFNQWVHGTGYENWRNRHVSEIGIHLINSTAEYLNEWYGVKRVN
jgi:trans-AT polyketide synthase/acyltransferase/oxidoreductase domain-containing protein